MSTQIAAGEPDPHLEPVSIGISSGICSAGLDNIYSPGIVSFQIITDTSTVPRRRSDQKSCVGFVVLVEMEGHCKRSITLVL